MTVMHLLHWIEVKKGSGSQPNWPFFYKLILVEAESISVKNNRHHLSFANWPLSWLNNQTCHFLFWLSVFWIWCFFIMCCRRLKSLLSLSFSSSKLKYLLTRVIKKTQNAHESFLTNNWFCVIQPDLLMFKKRVNLEQKWLLWFF